MTWTTWTKAQRIIAAADLWERCARAARADRAGEGAYRCAQQASALYDGDESDPESRYRCGLKWLQAPEDDIDAAVDAIARGEHPPDSLPGRVAEYRHKAREEDASSMPGEDSYENGHRKARSGAARWFLSLLGCETTP